MKNLAVAVSAPPIEVISPQNPEKSQNKNYAEYIPTFTIMDEMEKNMDERRRLRNFQMYFKNKFI
jgi:hypothetical protein